MVRGLFNCRFSCLKFLLFCNSIVVLFFIILKHGGSMFDRDDTNKFPEETSHVKDTYNEAIVGIPSRDYDVDFSDRRREAGGFNMDKFDPALEINFIPPVPKFSVSDIVYRLSDRINEKFLSLDNTVYKYKILILTPLHNSAKNLFRYAREIEELEYAHELISIAFGEDGSTDNTVEEAKSIIENLEPSGFRDISFYQFDLGKQQVDGDWNNVHQRVEQYKRRQHIAKARNFLLKKALKDHDYVLWIDSDIADLPPDIIQHLLYAKKDVVTPTCVIQDHLITRNYDKNIWRETLLSLENQKHLRENFLIVEGYGATSRIYLPDLRAEGRVVPIDGVGGCTLLVRAECHRKGLDFPEKLFDHHIETEGLAKKAKKMGYSVYGLPFVQVFHV